jgi:LmbE family N-acetylglucosaminyl deacetylase
MHLPERILAVGAHADDIEIGCSASLAKAIEAGSQVFCCTFSAHDPHEFPDDDIESEWRKSIETIGAQRSRLFLLKACKHREFEERRHFILTELEKIRAEFDPQLVFTHSSFDTNQDHQQVHQEVVRVFKRHCTILGWEFPSNDIVFESRAFSTIAARHLQKKYQALQCYASQKRAWDERNARYGYKTRGYLDMEYLSSWANIRGYQIGEQMAECFEVIRLIVA